MEDLKAHRWHILIVEDEPKMLTMIADFLRGEGFRVSTADSGEGALDSLKEGNIDLIVLDLLLPGIDGLEVCRRIRAATPLPIIMLTAKADEVDKLIGLELGADDYITKPFSLRELAARIRTVLRRSNPDPGPAERILYRDLRIDVDGHRVEKGGNPIPITPTEFKILCILAANPGRVYSRLQLVDAVLGEAYQGYERSIDTHISNLRKKLGDDYIQTVYGVGYKM
ncbi:MAG: response regulator transcription factor [Limnochordia bacterium]|jgi:DNA-binding response OmpR family regulator